MTTSLGQRLSSVIFVTIRNILQFFTMLVCELRRKLQSTSGNGATDIMGNDITNNPTALRSEFSSSEENGQVLEVLDALLKDVDTSKWYLGFSVDTELVQLIRKLKNDPSEMFRIGVEAQSELFVNHFLSVFAKSSIIAKASAVACRIDGGLCDIWILTLNKYDVTREERFAIYDCLRSGLGLDIFKRVRLDFLVASEDEVTVPEGYKIYRPISQEESLADA